MRPIRAHIPKLAPRIAALALSIFAAFALTGCQSISATPQYTQVRYIDASPDAPQLDVYQGATPSLYNIGFGSKSSYIPITPGSYLYSVSITGTQQQLANVRGTFTLGDQFTILVGNISAGLQMTILKDQSTPAPIGQVALRFLHQATRLGPVDIYLVPTNGQLTGATPILAKVPFGNTPTYINVPSGAYSVVVLPAGTPTTTTVMTATPTVIPALYSGNQVSYPSTSARTILLLDQPTATSSSAQIITANDYDPPAAN